MTLEEQERDLVRKLKAVRSKITIQKNKSQPGRPRSGDWCRIKELRREGWSLMNIARHLKIHRSAVQYALRQP